MFRNFLYPEEEELLALDGTLGIAVFMYDKRSPRDFLWLAHKIGVSPGVQLEVGLNRVAYNKLAYPYSECSFDADWSTREDTSAGSELVRYLLRNDKVYTRSVCFEFCFEMLSLEM